MIRTMKNLTDWRKWRPGYSAGKLMALCLLGWLIVNSSALTFFLGLRPYGAFPDFRDYLMTIFNLLSGIAWAQNWFFYWLWIPLLAPLFIVCFLIWLKRPSIFTAGILAVSGMVTGPANRIFVDDLPYFSAPFAAIFLICIWLTQKVWDNWDAPAPTPEETEAKHAKRSKRWPVKKRIILVAIPLGIYVCSSCLCALGGAYRQECAVAELALGLKGDRYFPKSWRANTWTYKLKEPKPDFSMSHLIAQTWRKGEFGPALMGRVPYSWSSLIYLTSGMRFPFIVFFLTVYGIWLWRPTWILYIITTGFFLLGVCMAKGSLVWQFLYPVEEYPQLRELVPNLLYLWAKHSPF